MSTNLDIRLKRASKTYAEGDVVAGVLHFDHVGDFRHDGITLVMFGEVTLDCNPKNPFQLMHCLVDICKPGKIPSGSTDIPFEIPLEAGLNRKIYETYHGVYVNIKYKLRCDVRRGFLGKNFSKEVEFCVELPKRPKNTPDHFKQSYIKPLNVSITPSVLRSTGADVSALPNFKINLHLDSVVCNLDEPFTGTVSFEKGLAVLKSAELQLVRVESCAYTPKGEPERTEIQSIQIVDGNVPDNVVIPIWMPFPKLFTCPTLLTTNFTIEFEANLLITFRDKHLINENIGLTLIRD